MNAPALLLLVTALLTGAAVPNDRAKAAFDRGERALGEDRLNDAAAAYREALAATPGYAAALNGLGSVLFKQGKKEEALTQFRAAIQADPDFKLGYFNLGYAARKMGDFAGAARAYERYTQLDATDPDGFYGLGESYRQSGEPQKAVAAYQQYLDKEKRPTEQKYIDRAKQYVSELKAQAAAHPAAGSPTPATASPAAAPASASGQVANPQLATTRIADGDRLMQERNYRGATQAYQDAVNADPSNVTALFNLGRSYAVLGYYQQAVDQWTRVTQLTQDPEIRRTAQDNIAKARSKMEQVGAASPQGQGKPVGSGPIAESTRERARQSYELGVQQINGRDYASAVQSLSQAISLEPTLAVAYIARGSANIGLRRFAEAAADYQYALRLDGAMASPLYGLAEAYRGMARPQDARGFYERYVGSTAKDVRPELKAEAQRKLQALR